MKFIKSFFISFRNLISKKTEYFYKKVEPLRPRHILQKYGDGKEKCTGCMICTAICPVDAIYIEGEEDKSLNPKGKYAKIFEIDYGRCIFCGFCVEICPEEALIMVEYPEPVFSSRREMILKKEDFL
ncbi:MAG: NADH-quinone oxidoreductase subunit I [candidate division WOR-3 bacterium]